MKRNRIYISTLLMSAAVFLWCAFGAGAQQEQTNQSANSESSPTTAQAAILKATPVFGVGDRVQVVRKNGKTQPAVITEVKEGGYRVRFDGSKNAQDETAAASAVSLPANLPAYSPNQTWNVGDKVGAQWSKDQKYYGAIIVSFEGGRYKVHYIGDADSGDELREATQIRPFKDWTWKDAAGKVRSEQELKDIFARHKQWLDSGGSAGEQANLAGATLENANLPGINLERANLERARFSGAQLKGAVLNGANLRGAALERADLAPAFISKADLTRASLVGTNLGSADLSNSNLTGALLIGAHLNKAFLVDADLTGATLKDAELTDAAFDGVNLTNVYYEPKNNPEIRYIAGALNLQTLRYTELPDALVTLRKSFADIGFREQQNKITYAVKRSENELLWQDAFQTVCPPDETPLCGYELKRGRECANGVCAGEPQNVLYYYLNLIFFDWTVRYGMRPERALIMVFFLWLICAFIYALFIHYPGKDGIYLIKTRKHRDPVRTRGLRIVPHRLNKTECARHWHWWRWWRREWRIFRLGMFFSLMTTFNIGFKEFDVGRWLGLLTKREYELIPRHWTRTVAGFQSLVSLYLIAMWILSHFGQPFE
ncbi:MAG: pentapeptide repeat-containing protein [Acidobacteriota bacterium]|nr:pentapeptide repeat-containing protein [Acidobacteriota bacterium]